MSAFRFIVLLSLTVPHGHYLYYKQFGNKIEPAVVTLLIFTTYLRASRLRLHLDGRTILSRAFGKRCAWHY